MADYAPLCNTNMEGSTMSGYTIVKGHGKWTVTHSEKIGTVTVIGNGHVRDLAYAVPDWADSDDGADGEAIEGCFTYKGNVYFLSEFLRIDKNAPSWLRQFDGYLSDSFFSGVVVKYPADEYEDGIRVYTYY